MGWLVEVHCATQGAPFLLEIGRWNYRNNFGSIWVSLAMPCNMGFENDASWCIKTPGQRSCKRSRCEPQILGFQAAEKNGIGPFGLAKQPESSHMLTLYLQKAGHEFATCTIQIWIHVYTCVWFMIVYVFHVCFMSGLCVITWYEQILARLNFLTIRRSQVSMSFDDATFALSDSIMPLLRCHLVQAI